MPEKSDLPQGTLDLLVLKIVALGPVHGYAIAQRLQQVSGDVAQVPQGSLYPALHRLEEKGAIEPKWGVSENNRHAKFYSITTRGRQTLRAEIESWTHYSAAIAKVIHATRQSA